jgi:hypothetical protein
VGKASEWKEHERKIDMSEIAIEMPASEQVVLPVLTRLNHGNINDTIARFAEEFTFKDRGIGSKAWGHASFTGDDKTMQVGLDNVRGRECHPRAGTGFNWRVRLPHAGEYDFSPFLTITSGRPFNITTGQDLNGDGLFTDRSAFATNPNSRESARPLTDFWTLHPCRVRRCSILAAECLGSRFLYLKIRFSF